MNCLSFSCIHTHTYFNEFLTLSEESVLYHQIGWHVENKCKMHTSVKLYYVRYEKKHFNSIPQHESSTPVAHLLSININATALKLRAMSEHILVYYFVLQITLRKEDFNLFCFVQLPTALLKWNVAKYESDVKHSELSCSYETITFTVGGKYLALLNEAENPK